MGQVSPSFAASVNGASAKSCRRNLFFCAGLQVFLVFAGQFDESRGQADILVNRIALVVARYDFGAFFVGHGRGNLVQSGAQQIRHDLLD
jgi:hypothetical protein